MSAGPFGDGHGNTPYTFNCPNGMVLTGMDAYGQNVLDGISSLYCSYPNNLSGGASDAVVGTPGAGGRGGQFRQYRCGANQYISDVNLLRDDSGWIGRMTLNCKDLNTGADSNKQDIGNSGNQAGSVPGSGITGIFGNGGNYIDGISFNIMDMANAKAAQFTEAGKIACCQGKLPKALCKMLPQSDDCDSYMSGLCQTTYKGSPMCSCVNSEIPCPNKNDKNCVANNGYMTKNMTTVACGNYINCTQINNLSGSAKALLVNNTQNCISTQDGTTTGQTTVNGQTTPTPAASTTIAGMTPTTLYIIIFVVFIVIAILIALFMRKPNKEVEYVREHEHGHKHSKH